MTTDLNWIETTLAHSAAVQELDAGELLFAQGAPAAAMFGVERGRVRLLRRTVDDHLVVLHTATAGELFAEAALFAGNYHCDAVAAVPSQVRRFPKQDVLAALRASPEFSERFIAALARQVQVLRLRLELRGIRSGRERVFQHLLLAAGPDGRTVAVQGDLQGIAADLGLTREAFYRALAALERGRVIARKDRHTIIILRRSDG